jgi:hypothetical protein
MKEVEMSREKPQADTLNKHPEEYKKDLNPNAMAGQNIGLGETEPSRNSARSVFDTKEVHDRLSNLSDDELKQIRVLNEGTRLEQGATYIDLKQLDRGEFTATGEMKVGPDNWYVSKKDVPYNLWNLLVGNATPERTGMTNEELNKKKGA